MDKYERMNIINIILIPRNMWQVFSGYYKHVDDLERLWNIVGHMYMIW